VIKKSYGNSVKGVINAQSDELKSTSVLLEGIVLKTEAFHCLFDDERGGSRDLRVQLCFLR
jgi:hypothetical protein